ncbi:PREDICTED: sec-independent protein translocase protein TATA, chloroplastic [Nelumbo nucifera]|uniref:Sec-independent protein translocase protein TATA, chloroplastic n=2 Tax=Nelumbo nucifera TaxID=4432 RepID=A0A822XHK6_NELNU|nr:PREDICTED: sec-independent protein translocase protein TATA, chloroplastic [Nelumbo nucifera]DAD19717.1 TPA_asm: hypothetical protein HUJ06_021180 [Nelumbo nucifera]
MEISTTLSLPSVPRISPSVSTFASCKSVFFSNGATDLHMRKKTNCLVLDRSKTQRGVNPRCLFGLGVPELVVIAGVAALVFGPKKLPEIGRSFGKTLKSFQQAAKEFESELKKDPESAIEATSEKPTTVSEERKEDTKVSSTNENF